MFTIIALISIRFCYLFDEMKTEDGNLSQVSAIFFHLFVCVERIFSVL